MKTFQDYCDLQESAAYDVGSNLLGANSLPAGQQTALTAAMQAFEMVLSRSPAVAVNWLNRLAESMPELKTVLQQHGLDSFRAVQHDARDAARKGRRVVSKGLAEVSPEDAKNAGVDVVAAPSADSHHNPLG